MNRIDTTDAARKLKQALEQFTQQKAQNFRLGAVTEMPGGGKSREIHAHLDGQPKSFVAIEVGGQVSIIDNKLGLAPRQAHDLLQKAETAQQQPGKSPAGLAWPERPKTNSHQTPNHARSRKR